MKYSIITSTKDPAGMNIKARLVELGFASCGKEKFGHKVLKYKDVKLYTSDIDSVDMEHIDDEVEGERLIFATMHLSASGKKTLTCHVPGNWRNADQGGREKFVCNAMPEEMKIALSLMELPAYETIIECTHHGPELVKPCMFIEIGSDESSWKDEKAGRVVAAAIMKIISANKGLDVAEYGKKKSVCVLGGGHYNQVAMKILDRTDYLVGHICPKYALVNFDEEMCQQVISKNGPRFEMFVLDWKGMGPEKARVVSVLEKVGCKFERVKKVYSS